MKIIKAEIVWKDLGFGGYKMPNVFVTYEDDKREFLMDYYPDEISFTEEEFVGLTRKECFDLFHKKDLAYLRS